MIQHNPMDPLNLPCSGKIHLALIYNLPLTLDPAESVNCLEQPN